MMNVAHRAVRLATFFALAGVLGGLGTAANAAPITVFHDQASFLAATTSPATDHFDDLPPYEETPAPSTALPRTVGAYGYVATSLQFVTNPGVGTLDCFFPGLNAVDPSDVWLGTNYQPDAVTIDAFTGGVSAIGGFFFATDFDYLPTRTALLFTITRADHSSQTLTLLQPDPNTFLGFVGRDIVSLRVDNLNPGDYLAAPENGTFITVNDLILAQAVPEPELAALLALGALAGLVARRRRLVR